MKQYIVSIPEVHYQDVVVNAKDGEEAIHKAKLGEGEYLDNALEYSHTSDNENFHVEEL